ncbi:Transposable element Tc3 transposase [Frankliniella fusca]|uniref:Transposable element Tc3 transposase n=1 Tax=Frankliniella fusca TaxID=407009 RepID=A0AAE1HZM3_9NEOP|nr:Transposable element Tc3 transposase [Frankliniella fusca]
MHRNLQWCRLLTVAYGAYSLDNIPEGTLCRIMTERLGEDGPFDFIQDNIHSAVIVREWFEDHPRTNELPWPANSPDMNPIENVFGLMALEWDPRFERTAEALETHAREVFRCGAEAPSDFHCTFFFHA